MSFLWGIPRTLMMSLAVSFLLIWQDMMWGLTLAAPVSPLHLQGNRKQPSSAQTVSSQRKENGGSSSGTYVHTAGLLFNHYACHTCQCLHMHLQYWLQILYNIRKRSSQEHSCARLIYACTGNVCLNLAWCVIECEIAMEMENPAASQLSIYQRERTIQFCI